MWSHYRWPSVDVKHQVLAQIVNMYADTFTVLPCISYCFDSDRKEVMSLDDFLYRQALDVALAKGFALARHGSIDGLGAWDTAVMRRYWQKAVMLAEGNWSYADIKNRWCPRHLCRESELHARLALHVCPFLHGRRGLSPRRKRGPGDS